MAKPSTIPVHKLEEHTDQRFHLERVDLQTKIVEDAILIDAHRDDHYIFMIQEIGWTRMMLDFQLLVSKENTVFFVLPGQVHDYQGSGKDALGWFLAIDPGLIPELFRSVLEDPLLAQKPLEMTAAELEPLLQCLRLVQGLMQQPASAYQQLSVYSLLASFIGMFVDAYVGRCPEAEGKFSRSRVITMEFRQLVAKRFKALKSPNEYAEALHLSLSYLNEIVKETSGFTVGYWIQHEVMLEAKRLLYYSQCSVKEIAFELGYEDHTYFSRLFKKVEGKTPGEFRKAYRE